MGALAPVVMLMPFLLAIGKRLRPLSVVFVLAFIAFMVGVVRDDCRAQPQQPCEPDQILEYVGTLLAMLACVATAAGWLLGDVLSRHERRSR